MSEEKSRREMSALAHRRRRAVESYRTAAEALGPAGFLKPLEAS